MNFIGGVRSIRQALGPLLSICVLASGLFYVAVSQEAATVVFGVTPDENIAIPNGQNNIADFDGDLNTLSTCVAIHDEDGNITQGPDGRLDVLNVQLLLIAENAQSSPSYDFQVMRTFPTDAPVEQCSGVLENEEGVYKDVVAIRNVGEDLDGTYHISMEMIDPDGLILRLKESDLALLPEKSDVEVTVEYQPGGFFQGQVLYYLVDELPVSRSLGLPVCLAEMTWNGNSLALNADLRLDYPDGVALDADGELSLTGLEAGTYAISASCHAAVSDETYTASIPSLNIFVIDYIPEPGATLTSMTPVSGSASGGVAVTLIGTELTGATSVTFDGVAATSVNVVNSTTVTAIAPAHAAGTVDVVIDTPAGGATLADAFTYQATALGQSAHGGIIAGLDGGLNNLIASPVDNSAGVEWALLNSVTGASSNIDGASNTAAIVNEHGADSAANVCAVFEVDSQGNTPCEAGNACYSDWFMPATDQLDTLYTNRAAVGGFAAARYWSSSESDVFLAWHIEFTTGTEFLASKPEVHRLRCVRSFIP